MRQPVSFSEPSHIISISKNNLLLGPFEQSSWHTIYLTIFIVVIDIVSSTSVFQDTILVEMEVLELFSFLVGLQLIVFLCPLFL